MDVISYWTETGEFTQSTWLKILRIIGKDGFTLWVTVPFIWTFVLYWTVGGLYLLMDITEKPAFLRKYKIQPGTNEPMNREKLTKLLKTVLFNQFVIGFPMAFLNWHVMKERVDMNVVELFPSPARILLDLIVCLLLNEIGFYYSHRLLHSRLLYKIIHKKHHEWTAPIAISAMYCNPIEHTFSNLVPPFLGLFVMRSHPATAWIWFSIAIMGTLNDHSDYHFPLLPSPEAHDFHHLKFNNCYGVIGLLDWLHGTDKMFRASRAFDRHKISLTIASQREKFPDIVKKTL
ncbi:fatty acid hydroxylase domain-containing protein 2-like [Phlebotomus argentipes]|uniref:fatty acid hydroxylase domain-containing protein 2-like n=1 Tax=Phlebotomus argentipes TaxID=94469 RepID=UPI0028929BA5|nr:fatty acid hydroxylase domain-containing protein 2-like [Phlebotomus argentipes]